jgi:hypothetical protein
VPTSSTTHAVDFDLHGIVGVRVISTRHTDIAVVRREFGLVPHALNRPPDIVIRFVEKIELSGRGRHIGLRDAEFDDDGFFVLRRRGRAYAKVHLPIDSIADGCEITCEAGITSVPLLMPIVNLTALAKGIVPLHASAFMYEGVGVVVCGWAKGGKTEALLAFMGEGAEYVGDEWVYIDPAAARVYGLLQPIKIWDWHLAETPYQSVLTREQRTKLRLARTAQRIAAQAPSDIVARLQNRLESERFVYLTADTLFSRESCRLEGPLNEIVFAMSRDDDSVTAEETDVRDVIDRMVFSNWYERLGFLSAYLKFRFAFPHKPLALAEHAVETERRLLSRALADTRAHVLYHPFPAPIPALFRALDGTFTRS